MPVRIYRRGAAAIICVPMVAFLLARASAAGVVTPPPSDLPQTIQAASNTLDRHVDAAALSMPVPPALDSQPFWFPGVDVDDVNLTSVPVRSQDGDGAGVILSGTQQHPLIPLPASAWTGMAGLLALGAIKVMRNFRKLLG